MRATWLLGCVLWAGIALGCSKSTEQSDAGAGAGGSGGTAGHSGSGGGGAAGCDPACSDGRDCCDARCVNLQNDPKNCGTCGETCGVTEYCGGGQCVAPPCETMCNAFGSSCCGSECCSAGQLCCDPQGPIDTSPRCADPDEHGSCPPGCAPLCICASPDTPIATLDGVRSISSLTEGDLVYSIDRGELAIVPIVRVQRTPVLGHHVTRVTMTGGVALEISAGHPTADGRTFGELRSGDELDGVTITGVETIPYLHDATWDILPASDTGSYFAGGVLIGSTLASAPQLRTAPTVPFEGSRKLRMPVDDDGRPPPR